ncbi:MAG TPA: S41 family peptidase [Burkholderiaceae bacterium]|jgi:hypothetical protein
MFFECHKRGAASALVLGAVLSACGGGGGSDGGSSSPPPPVNTSTPLQPSSTYAQRCAPENTQAPSPRSGSLSIEKQWMRSYFDEAYLWNTEVPTVDASAAAYSGTNVATALDNYFNALLTPQFTSTGARRDKFSFMMSTSDWNALAGSGQDVGYGLDWNLSSQTAPRHIRVAYIDAGGTAQTYKISRGYELISADGVSADANDSAGVDTLNSALFPATAGEYHSFVFRLPDGVSTAYIGMYSGTDTQASVFLSEVVTADDGSRVGHLIFNNHLAPAEAPLISAIQNFKAQGITDLVLDMRYNGGGYLYIASELAYMIAGPTKINSRNFDSLNYNARRTAENTNTPFYSSSCNLDSNGNCTSSQALPTLNLSRVYVLTQGDTCSASEAVINGLLGVDVDVIQIGGTTCGKPYGFTAQDNCGYSYFPIEFQGVNAKGFGDYSDGFTPGGASIASSGRTLHGCQVSDDFSHELNDRAEGQLAGALHHRATGQCPVQTLARQQSLAGNGEGASLRMQLRRSPALTNAIAGGRH